MPNEQQTPQKVTVVYSPLRISWRNVLLGGIIGLLIVAIGVFAFSYYTPNATPVPSVIIKKSTESAKTATKSATPSTKKTETADWKTFESNIHNYTVKYPSSWTFSKSSRELESGYFAEDVLLNVVSKEPNTPSIKILGNYAYPQEGWCKKSINPTCLEESIVLGGKESTKWTNTGEADEIYYTKPTSNYYVVIFVNFGGDKRLTTQVLSTFKFLD